MGGVALGLVLELVQLALVLPAKAVMSVCFAHGTQRNSNTKRHSSKREQSTHKTADTDRKNVTAEAHSKSRASVVPGATTFARSAHRARAPCSESATGPACAAIEQNEVWVSGENEGNTRL